MVLFFRLDCLQRVLRQLVSTDAAAPQQQPQQQQQEQQEDHDQPSHLELVLQHLIDVVRANVALTACVSLGTFCVPVVFLSLLFDDEWSTFSLFAHFPVFTFVSN